MPSSTHDTHHRMSGGTTVEQIDAVDAFARTLFVRAKHLASTSPRLDIIAEAVRTLHLALRHLRIEAADSDSFLNTNDVSLYARQLRPIVEDCTFALTQLETFLARDAVKDDDAADGRVTAIRAKLKNEKANIEMFLNTVQLHNPATRPNVGAFDASSQTTLDGIKDQVDAIAKRLFAHREGGFSGEESLWKEFKMELEKEGFSPEVLRKHKDVLRAYIRELESMSTNGGTPPTVRGLLAYEASSAPSPKEMMGPFENEKCFPSMKAERRMPDSAPVPPPPPPAQVSYERHSSSEDYDTVSGDSMALISTRDLVAMDSLNAGMANMQLQPPGRNYSHASPGNSPRSNQKYLPSNMPTTLPPPPVAELSGSPGTQLLGSSPRYVPPLAPYSSAAAPYGSSPLRSHLAPDRWGNEIPMDAQWTRIKRSLVSPEVLERAGVRYEARPEFVAVLGHLSREQIAEFARRSAEARAARSGGKPLPRKQDRFLQRERQDSKSSRTDEDDDESVLWDESDTTDSEDDRTSDKGTKSYPYIVSPPNSKEKASPSSTVEPKSILKNKNENHVRFDPSPREVEGKSPRSVKDDRRRDREHHSRRHRDHRDRSPRERDGSGSRYRDGEKRSGERRSGERERYHDDHREKHHRDRRGERRDDRARDERSRDDRARDERTAKKKSFAETLGAVGIGGAAVSLLSVLAEAASGV